MPEYRIVHTKNNDYSNNLLLGSFQFFISLNIPKCSHGIKIIVPVNLEPLRNSMSVTIITLRLNLT